MKFFLKTKCLVKHIHVDIITNLHKSIHSAIINISLFIVVKYQIFYLPKILVWFHDDKI